MHVIDISVGQATTRTSRDENDGCPAGSASSAIQQFYGGSNVLITGATGFMGKVLVEKLLRSCAGINSIYLLVRNKRGQQMKERIDQLVKDEFFDRLRSEQPDFKSKLIAVEGDISMEDLGLDESTRHLLAEHVDIVFHVAATVKFDEKLNIAIKQNVRATRDLLDLCRTFNRLKVVMHVSTAFSNCPSSDIREDFYEPPMNSELAIKMADNMEESKMDAITAELISPWPNSYTFTKALAEDVVKISGKDLPVGIFRPSIVFSTLKEPVSGWINKKNGPSRVLAASAAGLLRTMQIGRRVQADIVPCDLAINALISAAWDVGEKRSADIPIFNFTKPTSNSLTWGDFYALSKRHWNDLPPSGAMWYWVKADANGRRLALLCRFFLHTCPAVLVDTVLRLTGNKPKMCAAYRNVHKLTDMLIYFNTRTWYYEEKNMADLWNKMDDTDRAMFPCDMRAVNWQENSREIWLGIRKHVLKDREETLPAARRRYRRLRWLHYSVLLVLFIGILAGLCGAFFAVYRRFTGDVEEKAVVEH